MPTRTPLTKNERVLKLQFGVAIRQRRKKLGLTQEALAKRAGMHRTYLADLELGKRNPALTNIEGMAEALGLTLTDFFRLLERTPLSAPRRR